MVTIADTKPEPLFFSIIQAAQALNCSTSTVRRLIRSGEIPTRAIGTGTQRFRRLIPRSFVQSLAAQGNGAVHQDIPVDLAVSSGQQNHD